MNCVMYDLPAFCSEPDSNSCDFVVAFGGGTGKGQTPPGAPLPVVDSELTASIPPQFTAYQGVDALFHSTGGYLGQMADRMSDMVALTATENVGGYLVHAVEDGSDEEARERMAFANAKETMGGSSFAGPCELSHEDRVETLKKSYR